MTCGRRRRRNAPEQSSAAWGLAGVGDLGLQSSVWIAVWCKRASAARVVHWGTQGGGAGLRAWSSTARAVRRQRSSPGLAWSGSYGAPRANTSSAKGMAGLGLLTKVWSGWGRDAGGVGRRDPAADAGGASRSERRWAPPGLDPLESKRLGAAEVECGQGGQEHQRRRGNSAAARLTRGGVKARFRWCRGRGR